MAGGLGLMTYNLYFEKKGICKGHFIFDLLYIMKTKSSCRFIIHHLKFCKENPGLLKKSLFIEQIIKGQGYCGVEEEIVVI